MAGPTTSDRSVAGADRAAAGRHITVAPVRGRRDLKRFLTLPWSIYADDPAWVPPLLAERKALLDRDGHPFHEHADVEYFLARREGDVAGRIAAIVNHRHNEYHDDRIGFFGFFESVDDAAVARALFDAAGDWLRRRGMEAVRGPMNLSTNEECGTLVEGFDRRPAVMMPHTAPYHPRLLEAAGFAKAKDLLAYWLDDHEPPERLVRGVGRLQRSSGVRLRTLDTRRFDDEVRVIRDIYNNAWERNWGFVPMTDAEFDAMAKQLRPVIDPELCAIAEVEGEPVAFALAVPDFNQALRHINGRLFPFGLLKLLWHRRNIDTARIITLGVKRGFRRMGLDAMLYLQLFRNGVAAGYYRAECSWVLEDNWEMRRAMERMGASVHKVYRIYERPLDAG